MNNKHLALHALKYNPFSPEVPSEALLITPVIDHFCWRVETQLISEGGFALVSGEPGTRSLSIR